MSYSPVIRYVFKNDDIALSFVELEDIYLFNNNNNVLYKFEVSVCVCNILFSLFNMIYT